jgi:hypothetical protein
MKSSKKWYWLAALVVVAALATAATRVKGDSATPRLEKFQADGTGTLDASGVSLTATIKGNEVGTAALSDSGFAESFLGFTGNGGDNCFLGGGNITVTAADGSVLNMSRSGIDCTVSGTGFTNAASGNHAYIISGGTGRFAGATGGGNYVFTINDGKVTIHIDGNIQAPGDRDSR